MIEPKDFCSTLLDLDIDFYAGVPDSLLKDICAFVTDNFSEDKHKITANEGSAIGLAIGYYLSSKKLPIVYMQNSGIGNAVNPLISLADKKVYSVPMILMIGWRGEPGKKDEPQHLKQGLITEDLLKVLEIPYKIISENTSKEELSKLLQEQKDLALSEMSPVALLIKKGAFSSYEMPSSHINKNNLSNQNLMSRAEFIDYFAKMKFSQAVISTTGVTSRQLLQTRKENYQDTSGDFLTVGGMGHASQIALGIAINRPNIKVTCIDGDGALLMHMGSLASIADSKCKNYYYILLNNSVHDSVGGQPIGAKSIDFLKIAEASGFKKLYRIENQKQLSNLDQFFKEKGPIFIEVILKSGFPSNLIRPDKTPIENKYSFEKFLLNQD